MFKSDLHNFSKQRGFLSISNHDFHGTDSKFGKTHFNNFVQWKGTGQEPGCKGSGNTTGGGRRQGGKRDSQARQKRSKWAGTTKEGRSGGGYKNVRLSPLALSFTFLIGFVSCFLSGFEHLPYGNYFYRLQK